MVIRCRGRWNFSIASEPDAPMSLGWIPNAISLMRIALIVPVLMVVEWGIIKREEQYLEQKFGDEYLRYKSQVRRWI